VQDGRFREDLYYRINVIEIRVPSLRERVDDIPDLAETILRRLSRRMGLEAPDISASALDLLRGYAFPGNVRELENVLERALTLCTSDTIEAADIQLRSASPPGGASAAAEPGETGRTMTTGTALGEQLDSMQRDAIVKALEQTRYNKTAAAKLLGMSFRALRYRIKKLGIE
jgi:two-component system response regulator PilR (NtrC family)